MEIVGYSVLVILVYIIILGVKIYRTDRRNITRWGK